MAKVPVEIIVKALDKTAPAVAAMAKRMTALKATVSRLNPFGGLTKAIGDSAFGQAARRFGRALGTKAIEGGLTQVQAKFKALGAALPALGLKLLGVGTAAAAIGWKLVSGAAESGAALGRMSKLAGVSADFFASTQFAAEQAGVGGEVFGKSMVKLSKQMGEMTVGKGGPLLGFLNEVSPSFARQVKGAKTTEEAMLLLGEAFEKIEDPQRRATLAAKVFGDEAVSMGEFLHKGNRFIEDRRKLFLRLAGSQEQFAANSVDFERSLGLTTLAFTGLRNAAATHLLPILTTLATTLAEFLAKNRDKIAAWAEKAAAAFQKWADDGGLERLVAGISGLANSAVSLAEKLGPTGTAIVGIAALSPTTTIALVSLGAQMASLAFTMAPALAAGFATAGVAIWGALAPLAPFLLAGGALLLLGKTLYDNWDAITAKFEEFGDTLRWAVVDTWKQVRPILSAMSSVPGFGAALAIGDSANRQTEAAIEARTGQSVASINARALRAGQSMGGAMGAQLTPQGAAAATASNSSETRVEVNFSNLPRGARVSTESSADAVNTSLGYASMVSGQ